METSTLMKLNEKISVTVLFPYSQQAQEGDHQMQLLWFFREKKIIQAMYTRKVRKDDKGINHAACFKL